MLNISPNLCCTNRHIYIKLKWHNWEVANSWFNPASSSSKQHLLLQLFTIPLLLTDRLDLPSATLRACFSQTKVVVFFLKKRNNFFRVQIHWRWHVQPPLFVPVKCALAWCTGIIAFHSHTSVCCHSVPLHHFTLAPTLFSPLPALWELPTKGMSGPTSQPRTHLYHKKN